jgi:AraC family cel operon transcriptional repressor
VIVHSSNKHITSPSGIFSNLISSNQIWEMHLHDGFYEIMVILNGSLIHDAEGSSRQMTAGDIVFMPQGTAHALYNASSNLLFLNLAVLPLIITQAMGYLGLRNLPNRIVFSQAPAEILNFLNWNYTFFKSSVDSILMISAERNALTLLLPHCCHTEDTSDWFDTLITQMKKRENFQTGVSRMQKLAFCSPSHLSRTCRDRLGITPTQFVEKTRIEYAVQLLRYTNGSIRDIGIECGFANHGYFYKCFKRIMGVSPGQYRNQRFKSNEGRPFGWTGD